MMKLWPIKECGGRDLHWGTLQLHSSANKGPSRALTTTAQSTQSNNQ